MHRHRHVYAWPKNAGAGTITGSGLRSPLAFRGGQFGYVPEPAAGEDLFAPGAVIRVTAPGDVTPAFTASVTRVTPLEAPFQNRSLVDGRDSTVTWTAAGDARIQVALVVGWHGAPYEAMLLCETEDDGELLIPGAIIAKLPRASSSLESNPSWIMRFDRTAVIVPAGPIEIIAGSQVFLHFSHPSTSVTCVEILTLRDEDPDTWRRARDRNPVCSPRAALS